MGGDSLGLTWIRLYSLGLTWMHLDSVGLTWSHLDSLGLIWTHLGSPGFTRTHLDSLGFTWAHQDSLGLTWTHLDSLGLTWSRFEFTSIYPGPWTHPISQGKRESPDLTREKGRPPGPKREKGKGSRLIISLPTHPYIQTPRVARTHETKRFPGSGGEPKGGLTPPNLRSFKDTRQGCYIMAQYETIPIRMWLLEHELQCFSRVFPTSQGNTRQCLLGSIGGWGE